MNLATALRVVAMTAGLSASAMAQPATPPYPGRTMTQQPDGQEIPLKLRGSINYHWFEDDDGFTVVQNGDTYVYARLNDRGDLVPDPSLVVGKVDPAKAGLAKHLRPTPEALERAIAQNRRARPSQDHADIRSGGSERAMAQDSPPQARQTPPDRQAVVESGHPATKDDELYVFAVRDASGRLRPTDIPVGQADPTAAKIPPLANSGPAAALPSGPATAQHQLRQAELNDKIRELERNLERVTKNNFDLRERAAKFSTLLRQNGLSDDISNISFIKGMESPPPVVGEVKRVDPWNRRVELTIGSDDGLVIGNELFLFSQEPRPEYLGKITIIAVDPNQAVGRVNGSTYQGKKIQEGDIVGSSFESGREQFLSRAPGFFSDPGWLPGAEWGRSEPRAMDDQLFSVVPARKPVNWHELLSHSIWARSSPDERHEDPFALAETKSTPKVVTVRKPDGTMTHFHVFGTYLVDDHGFAALPGKDGYVYAARDDSGQLIPRPDLQVAQIADPATHGLRPLLTTTPQTFAVAADRPPDPTGRVQPGREVY